MHRHSTPAQIREALEVVAAEERRLLFLAHELGLEQVSSISIHRGGLGTALATVYAHKRLFRGRSERRDSTIAATTVEKVEELLKQTAVDLGLRKA